MGVSSKTGYRWRTEMGGVIAKKRTEGTGRYLSLLERQRIASLRERGVWDQGGRPPCRTFSLHGVP